jgi:hypothetical protein
MIETNTLFVNFDRGSTFHFSDIPTTCSKIAHYLM